MYAVTLCLFAVMVPWLTIMGIEAYVDLVRAVLALPVAEPLMDYIPASVEVETREIPAAHTIALWETNWEPRSLRPFPNDTVAF